MEDLEIFKKKVSEKYATSHEKRLIHDLLLTSLEKIELILSKLDCIEAQLKKQVSALPHVVQLKAVDINKDKDTVNANINS